MIYLRRFNWRCDRRSKLLSYFAIVLFVLCLVNAVRWLTRQYHFSNLSRYDVLVKLVWQPNSSQHNTGPMECNSPMIQSDIPKKKPVDCSSAMEDWVYVTNGTFHISSRARTRYGEITCEYKPVLRRGDFSVSYASAIKPMKDGQPLQTDFFKVSCVSKGGQTYNMVHAAVAWNNAVHERLRRQTAEKGNVSSHNTAKIKKDTGLSTSGSLQDLSVLMIGYDSLSHFAWRRLLPRARDFLVNSLGGIELKRYNILGDGTPAALLPILTGKREEELPEVRRGFPGAKTLDDHPWLWRQFSQRGYVTAWAEDCPSIGTFHYRMLGFKDQPTDHFMRPYHLAAKGEYKNNPPLCMGSKPRHVRFINWFGDLLDMYKNVPKFFFGFSSEMSHSDNFKVQAVDDDLVTFLKEQNEKGHLNSTLLILMADHGARYGQTRASAQGKMEERMPYFSFRFPPWFNKRYPDIVRNLKTNVDRLTTPFDIYETFQEILNYTGSDTADIRHRGVSLFKEVPAKRTCDDAEIGPHWCACLEWQTVSQSNALVVEAVRAVIAEINQATIAYRKKCAELTLFTLIWVGRYVCTSKDSLVRKNFEIYWNKYNRNPDNRYEGISCEPGTELYQVSFTTTPGGGHFEAVCTRDPSTGTFKSNAKDISRINKYGTQAACIQDTLPHLRSYCYCT